jgi:hypothetical protein
MASNDRVRAPDHPPSTHRAFDLSPGLDELVLSCLKKKPSDRPPTVRELCDRLGECAVETAWTREDAKKWWETRMEPEVAVTFGDWT